MFNRDTWDKLCERTIVAMLLAAVVLNAILFGGVLHPEMGFPVLIALTGWLVRIWISPGHRILIHPVLWPLLAFIGFAIWRTQSVTVPYVAQQAFVHLTLGVITFVVSLENLHRQETVRWLVHMLVAVGCLIAGYAILQLLSESDSVLWLQQPAGYSKRAGGTFVNPNHLAGFLCILVPLATGVVFLGREPVVAKVFHTYAALVMLGGVAVTMSRGGWVATTIALSLLVSYILSRRSELRIPATVAAAALAVAAFGYLGMVDKARSRILNVSSEGNIDAGSSRLWLWRPAFAMWRDHPLIGVGPNHFDVEFAAYRPWQIQVHPAFTHNEYLQILTDYGVVGASIVAAGIVLFTRSVFRTTKFVERGTGEVGQRLSNRSALFFGAAAGLGGLAFHCLVDFDLQMPAISLLAALLGGVLAAHLRFTSDRLWFQLNWLGRLVMTIAGLATIAWLAQYLVTASREAHHLNQAMTAKNINTNLLGHLKAAAELAPGNPRTAFELGDNYRRLSLEGERDWKSNGSEAIRWLERSIALNPHDPEYLLSLARTRQWMGDTNGAARDFEHALKIGPYLVEVANHVAWNYLSRGRTNEAKALFDQSVKWNWYNNWMAITKKAELEAKGYR